MRESFAAVPIAAMYGEIPSEICAVAPGAVQCSPRIPGSKLLSDMADGSCAAITLFAPPGTIERRATLADALRVLQPGGRLTALAPNTKGGTRLADELAGFGCAIEESHKSRHRIVATTRGPALTGIAQALADGAPRMLADLQLWSQPGLFNWDRVDEGSRLLLDHLPALTGRGADLGCGIGVLARAVRQAAPQSEIVLIDIDARAIACARRNVPGDGVTTVWADARRPQDLPKGLDFVVTNPPFHDGGAEDKALGQAFIASAAHMLRPGGVLWLTANRHLPYEAVLHAHFETVEAVAQANGFKIFSARKQGLAAGAAGVRRAATAKVRR